MRLRRLAVIDERVGEDFEWSKSQNVVLLSVSLRCERLRMEARREGQGGCGQDTGHGHPGLSGFQAIGECSGMVL